MTDTPKLGYIGKIRLFKRDARLYIVIMSTSAFANGINSVVFNLYLEGDGIHSADFIGFFLSISMFATAGISFIAGLVTDRSSRKQIILLANLISFICVAIQYLTLDSLALVSSAVLIGLSGAFSQVAWSPYITDLSTDEERAHLFGFSQGIALLAVFAGNLFGGFLPGLFSSILGVLPESIPAYRLTLLFTLIPSLISLFLIILMSSDTPTSSTTQLSIKNVTNWSFIGKYATTVTTVGLGAGVIVMFFNLFFKYQFSASSELIGIIFGINTIILSSGNFIAPWLADRIGKVKTVVFTEALSIPFLLMIGLADSLPLAVTGYVARSVLMNMSGPVSNALFMEGLTKEERATAVGVVRTGDSLVRGIAANIGGWLLAMGLYRIPYFLVAGLYVLAIILFYTFFKNKEREIQIRKEVELITPKKVEHAPDIT
ncbi:MAG: MFS transporter [Candidatus Thorarchaeota archaeon]|nr:MFS transporter [Candidatus Thorarchaeota archaeon]